MNGSTAGIPVSVLLCTSTGLPAGHFIIISFFVSFFCYDKMTIIDYENISECD